MDDSDHRTEACKDMETPCSILGCLTIGDLWRKQAKAGNKDAAWALEITRRHRNKAILGLLDCVMCGEYFTECQCNNMILEYEVNDERN